MNRLSKHTYKPVAICILRQAVSIHRPLHCLQPIYLLYRDKHCNSSCKRQHSL